MRSGAFPGQGREHNARLLFALSSPQSLRTNGAQRIYIYFNNEHDVYAIKNTRARRRLMKAPSPITPERGTDIKTA